MDIDPIRRRLLELAKEKRISLSRLSRMLGKNPSYLQQFVRKGSPRKLEEHDRGVLARFFDVDEGELGRSPDIYHHRPGAAPRSPWIDVPRLRVGASAGPGAEPGDESAFDTFRFSDRWLRSLGLQSGYLSTILVSGDSMEPTLRHGDEILVDRAPRPLRDGIHVVRLGESLLVKRVDTSRPDAIMLISDNTAYPPMECTLRDLEIVGRVIWKGGRI